MRVPFGQMAESIRARVDWTPEEVARGTKPPPLPRRARVRTPREPQEPKARSLPKFPGRWTVANTDPEKFLRDLRSFLHAGFQILSIDRSAPDTEWYALVSRKAPE